MAAWRRGAAIALVLVLATQGCVSTPPDPDNVGAPTRSPDWSTRLPVELGAPRAATATADGVVVQASKGVAVLGRADGITRWQQVAVDGDGHGYTAQVAGDAVVLSQGRDTEVRVYDLRTGAHRFDITNSDSSSAAVFQSGLVVSDCGQGRSPCRVAALDLTTGVPRWERAFAEHTTVYRGLSGPDTQAPGWATVLVAHELADHTGSATALDLATGQELGHYPIATDSLYFTDAVTIQVSADPQRTCVVTVTAHDTRTGAARWTAGVGQAPDETSSESCQAVYTPVVVEGSMLATAPDGRPSMVDLTTGHAYWTGDSGTRLLCATDGVAVTRSTTTGELAGHDTATGRPLWRLANQGASTRWAATASRFIQVDEKHLTVRDVHTGRAEWAAADSNHLLGLGSDWLVSSVESGPGPNDPFDVRFYDPS
jgi:outer membrane protein assembly factor BamB